MVKGKKRGTPAWKEAMLVYWRVFMQQFKAKAKELKKEKEAGEKKKQKKGFYFKQRLPDDFSKLSHASIHARAKSNAMPGPWLVMSLPSTTTRSSIG